MQKNRIGLNIYTFQHEGSLPPETALNVVNWYLTGGVYKPSGHQLYSLSSLLSSWIVFHTGTQLHLRTCQTALSSVKLIFKKTCENYFWGSFKKDTRRMFVMPVRLISYFIGVPNSYGITRQLSKRRRFLVNDIYRGLCLRNIRLKPSCG